jgi:hypothetical protein
MIPPMLALLLAVLLPGCSASRGIAPLPAGAIAAQASLGGPVVDYFGGHKPLPITAFGASYGLDGRTTLHASLLPTQLALFGVFGAEVGASYELIAPQGRRPRVMLDGALWVFAGGRNPSGTTDYAPSEGGLRVFPDIQTLAAWPLGEHTLYTGVDHFVQVFPERAYFPSPMGGLELRFGRFGLQPEAKWIGWFADTERLSPDYLAPGKQGALSFQLGFNLDPGAKEAD